MSKKIRSTKDELFMKQEKKTCPNIGFAKKSEYDDNVDDKK